MGTVWAWGMGMDMGIWVSPCLQSMFYLFCLFVLLGNLFVSDLLSGEDRGGCESICFKSLARV